MCRVTNGDTQSPNYNVSGVLAVRPYFGLIFVL